MQRLPFNWNDKKSLPLRNIDLCPLPVYRIPNIFSRLISLYFYHPSTRVAPAPLAERPATLRKRVGGLWGSVGQGSYQALPSSLALPSPWRVLSRLPSWRTPQHPLNPAPPQGGTPFLGRCRIPPAAKHRISATAIRQHPLTLPSPNQHLCNPWQNRRETRSG